jgi:hypothetical protein
MERQGRKGWITSWIHTIFYLYWVLFHDSRSSSLSDLPESWAEKLCIILYEAIQPIVDYVWGPIKVNEWSQWTTKQGRAAFRVIEI